MKRDYRLYLDDIIEAIGKIEKYTKGLTLDVFREDDKTIDSVIRNFEIIGEAAKNVPESMRKEYPKLPWKEMAGMRDKLIHEYFGVKTDIVWKTIKERLSEVKVLSKEVLERMEKD
ncbi:MAG: DUF86 domain-containing protein [Candidatus Margulisiibacteriota bacterium]|nr:DUF86 domain-containing protein [Candidatus Margulisiibacteriota bacterium]